MSTVFVQPITRCHTNRLKPSLFLLALLLALLVTAASPSMAENIYWKGEAIFTPSLWGDTANWPAGQIPGHNDHALVHDFGASQKAMPVINYDVGVVDLVSVAWHNVIASLTIRPGGRLKTYGIYLGNDPSGGHGTLNIEGGEVYVRNLHVGSNGDGTLRMTGGELEAWMMWVGLENGPGEGLIDLAGGTLIVGGDARAQVSGLVASGSIVAYAGSGRVSWDYHKTNPGRVTLVGMPNREMAWDPTPGNGSTVPSPSFTTTILNWQIGDGAVAHEIYCGTDQTAVMTATNTDTSGIFRGRQAVNGYALGTLKPEETYYWRVDEVQSDETITPGQVWSFETARDLQIDLMADTWVATDALGRVLPGPAECGPPREDRITAMYYVMWFGHHGSYGPYNVAEIVAASPENPAFALNLPHYWDEPEAGYFLADDKWVIRRDLAMLAQAGVDLLVIESTNGWSYIQEALTLLGVWQEMKNEGFDHEFKFCFWTNAQSPRVVQEYYDAIYTQGIYEDWWFYLDGKPLILGRPDGQPTDSPQISVSPEVRDFFTWRVCWAWDDGYHKWQFVDYYPQDYGWNTSSDRPEQVVVTPASHPTLNIGKSHDGFSQPPLDEYDLPVGGTQGQGIHLAKQWERGRYLDPEIMYLTEWNEWIAGAYVRQPGDPPVNFLGQPVPEGGVYFVDQYNSEYNRDLAPSRGGYTDNYYYQTVDNVRRYEGVRMPPAAGGAATPLIDGEFAEWEFITPAYYDVPGDNDHRDHLGFGRQPALVNQTGRNDIVETRVARDSSHLYFMVETTSDLTPSTDPYWMLLFLNTDQDQATGWEGYDYVVNLDPPGLATTTLQQSTGGWNWSTVNSAIPFSVSGNQLELAIPRADLGYAVGDASLTLDFKWADNIQIPDDIREFFIHGDAAPDRRYNYRYQTAKQIEVVLVDEDFEDPDTPSWGDWDLSTAAAYSGIRSMECSEDDDAGLTHYMNTEGYDSFRLSFRYKLQNVSDSDNFLFWYHDGTQWNFLEELGINQNDVWLHHVDVRYNQGDDAKYFSPALMFHLQGNEMTGWNQFIWLDDVKMVALQTVTEAHSPYPPDGATDVSPETLLGWTAGAGAQSHDVYMGLSAPDTHRGNVVGSEQLNPGELLPGTTYYWRVDEQTPAGTVPGPVWTFTTGDPIPTLINHWQLY